MTVKDREVHEAVVESEGIGTMVQEDAELVVADEDAQDLVLYAGAWKNDDKRTQRIGCVIPAYNEEDSILAVLDSLLAQTRPPDEVHVIVNNCKDDTFWEASKRAGQHTVSYREQEFEVAIHVHDVGTLPERKVGALNIGFHLVEHCDYFLGVDGDTVLDRRAVENLLAELHADSRIGGISAIYTIDYQERGAWDNYLISGQRQQFASFNMLNLLRGRNMSVLGGQCSLFSIEALKAVRDEHRQLGPWVLDSEVEDSLLSIQLKRLGYLTKISATARANVGGMTTLKSLDAQQVKWNYGAIDLMWPGQRGNTTGMPFHPNVRVRWIEHGSMLMNMLVRFGLILLVAASLSISAFSFNPIWLIPPLVSVLLNLRIALSMKQRTGKDILFALLFFPAEIYMWLKIGHFLRAWTKFFMRTQVDNWAAQAAAESGKGTNAYLKPVIYGLVTFAALTIIWIQLPLLAKEIALWFAWPALAVLATLQTLGMIFKLIRRHRGYMV
ncbi:MAG: glycosyltransferase family 2 protein [bacterium]|nr:glycosyltransferase family 2 protein [bacterium]